MAYTKKIDFGGRAFKDVLGFTIAHWGKQPWRIMAIVLLALLSALADVLTPLYAGRLVDRTRRRRGRQGAGMARGYGRVRHAGLPRIDRHAAAPVHVHEHHRVDAEDDE
jgi:hypothetical protein